VEAVILLFQQTFLELSERLQQVEDRLSKNSSHSGKPPSTDGYENLRRKVAEDEAGRRAADKRDMSGIL
jgi:hypothetical protein